MLTLKSDDVPARTRRSGALVIVADAFILAGTFWLVLGDGRLATRVTASAVVQLASSWPAA